MKRIHDDAVLASLDTFNLVDLFVDCHILMNNSDTALACDCDRETRLGNGIHSRAHHRNVQLN